MPFCSMADTEERVYKPGQSSNCSAVPDIPAALYHHVADMVPCQDLHDLRQVNLIGCMAGNQAVWQLTYCPNPVLLRRAWSSFLLLAAHTALPQ